MKLHRQYIKTEIIGLAVIVLLQTHTAAQNNSSPSDIKENVIVTEKSTNSFTLRHTKNVFITDDDYKYIVFYPPAGLPEGADITNIQYSIRIDDNSDETNFYPSDYAIYLSMQWCANPYFHSVYENLGEMASQNDENYDDDLANDSDIELISRSSNAFNGLDPNQEFYISVKDVITGGQGIIDYATLQVYYEYSDPNPSTYETSSTWDAPLIVNHTKNSP